MARELKVSKHPLINWTEVVKQEVERRGFKDLLTEKLYDLLLKLYAFIGNDTGEVFPRHATDGLKAPLRTISDLCRLFSVNFQSHKHRTGINGSVFTSSGQSVHLFTFLDPKRGLKGALQQKETAQTATKAPDCGSSCELSALVPAQGGPPSP